MDLTANFKEVEHSYLIYVESPDPQMGTVTMDPANEGNIYKEGTEITVKAEPKDGYEFIDSSDSGYGIWDEDKMTTKFIYDECGSESSGFWPSKRMGNGGM